MISVNTSESAAWLAGFYTRFEAETRLLHKTEPFWRACQRCPDGHCCYHLTYSVQSGVGNPFMIEDWQSMLMYVRDAFSRQEKNRLARNILSKSEQCIFLVDGRCSIYPARAWSCRTHPYTVSFHPNPELFPVAEIALPSCPALGANFGLKNGEILIQKAVITERAIDSNLVKLKLKKHKPLWLIDATAYLADYEKHTPPADRPVSDWLALFALARTAGGEHGDLLSRYVEKVTERKTR
jgi:Fe-S-cluster containining protein